MRNLKSFIIITIFFFTSSLLKAQCSGDNTFNGTTVNTGCPGSVTESLVAGEYLNVNVVAGNVYTFSTCGSNTCDTYLTLADLPGGVYYAFNDDGGTSAGGCSEIVWYSNVNGTLSLLLDRYQNIVNPCSNSGCAGTSVTITCSLPPVNTEPCGATTLPVNSSCSSQTYDNTAVGSGYNTLPSCANYVSNDLWFSFTIPATGGANIDLQAGGMTNSGMAIYTGSDCSNLSEATCDADNGAGLMSNIDANFPPGTQIWVRVFGENDDQGTFGICITEIIPTVTASDCGDAINICSNAGFTIDPNGIGAVNDVPPIGSVGNPGVAYNGVSYTNAPMSNNDGCLRSGEKNSTWMVVTIASTGNLEFSFGAGGAQAGFYDWIMWPYNDNCGQISGGTIAPVTCNWNANSSGGTGAVSSLPAGGQSGNYEPPVPVICGEQYLICFSNYSDNSSTVPVQFGGTATVSCSGFITVGSSDITICEGGSGVLNANGADTYTWSPATGLSGTTGNTVTASPTTTTDYTVTGTTGCLTDDTTITVTVEPQPTITTSYTNPSTGANVVSSSLTSCGNEDIVLGASGSASGYVWSPSTGLSCTNCQNPTVSVGTSNLTYQVIGFSANNCPDTTEFNIIVAPVVSGFNQPAAQCLTGNNFSFTNTGTTGVNYSWDFGDTGSSSLENPTYSYSTSGTFTVEQIVSSGSCSDTTELTVTVDSLITPTFTSIAAVCQNATAPTLPTTSINGITGSWSPAVSTTTAGTQTYTFTPNAGQCADTASIKVTVNPLPVPTTSADSVLCNGGSTGSVTVTGVTGTSAFPGGYGYSWDDDATPPALASTQTANGLGIGTYTVIVTDLTTTCTEQTTATIVEPPLLTATNTPTNPACADDTTGSITANPSGGTVGYTYSWSPGGQTTQTATGLSAGILYTCTITDYNNCPVTTSATLTDPAGMDLDSAMTVASCGASDGTATVTVASGGSGNFTYSWSPGGQTTATATNIPAGPYIATVNDVTLGCTSTISVVVTSTSAITATATLVNDVLCNGDTTGVAYATSTDGVPTLTFLWDDVSASTNDTLTAVAGTYNVTVKDGNGCTGTASVVIGEPTPVIASITASTDETCLGANNGTATAGGAQGTGGYTYSWSPGGQINQTATGLSPGTYVVTVFDDNLCSDTISVVIGEGPMMTVSHDSTNVKCFGETTGAIDVTVGGAPGPISYAWTPSGGASEDPVGLAAGTYYLTATSMGCSVNDTVVLTEPTELFAVIDSSDNVTCFGNADGVAYGSASGGVTPYTYLWDAAAANQATATASSLTVGNYTITVTDSNNCTATAVANISEPTALNAVLDSLDAYCGLAQGTVWAQPTNGTAPYSYVWSSGGNTDTINGLLPGTYIVTVTDANNCKFSGSVSVNPLPGGTASISDSTDVSCNGGSDGTATVSVGGAYPGYTYLWDAAAGNQTANPAIGLAQGTYSVVVTDTLGCQMPTSVTINQPDSLILSLNLTNVFCPDSCNGSVMSVPGGGTVPYSYLWEDPSNQVTQSAFGLCSGFVVLNLTDKNGCSVKDSILINNPPKMILASGTDSSSCNQSDGSAYINVVANGIAPYTYQWDSAGVTISFDSLITNVAAGTYYAYVSDSLGCSVIDTVTIYDLSAPQIDSVVTSNVLCNGGFTGSAEVFVSGGAFPYTYLWDDGANQATPNATNLAAGGYVVTVTDTNGCIISSPANIGQPPALVLTSGGVNPSCTDSTDGSVWVNAQGGIMPYSYVWNSNPAMINDTIYNLPEIVGGYSVTVTDSNNCTATANVDLVDPALFTINVSGVDVDCAGSNTGSATVSENNGISPFTYLWNDISAQTAQTASGLVANTYNVIATDDNGCVANGSIIIDEPDTLIITLDTTGNVSCNGLSDGFAQVNVVGGSGTYSYNWILGGTSVSTQQNPVGLAAGLYTVIVTDDSSCTDQINVNITEPAVLVGSVITSDAKCYGANSGFAYATNVTGGTAPYTYQWDDLGLQQTDTAFNLLAGNYLLDITDSLGCQVLDIPVVIGEPTEIILNPSTISSTCGFANGTASVTVGGGISPYNFIWNDSLTQGNAVATGLSAGGYQVIVTDAQGCQDSAIANVTDLGSPTVVMDSITNVTCNGAGDGMAYASVSGGVAPYTYLWTNGDTTLNATNLNAQSYTITVTDDNGCTASADTVIQENAGVVVVASLIQNVSCNGGSDGIVYANANGGTGAATITYSWDDPLTQANDTAFNLIIGTYVVTATDLNNCTAYDTVEVIEPLLLTTILDSLKNLTCYQSNDGYIDVSAAGGTLPYSWSSNPIGGPTLSGLAAGNYYLIVTDAKGCIDSTDYTLTEPNELVITEVTTASTCGNFNGSAEVTSVTGGTGPYSYNWNDPTNQQTALADSLLANTYTVVITDFNGCFKDTAVTVLNTPGSTIDSVTVVDVDCFSNNTGSAEVFVSGSAPYTYTWTPSGQTTALASSLVAGVYSVQVTDANSCITAQNGIIVNEPSKLTASINVPSYACYGQVVQLMGAGAGGVQPYNDILWVEPFGYTNLGPIFDTVTSSTNYILTIKDANGCPAITNKLTTVGSPLNITATGDVVCLGDTASVFATASGGNPANAYEYTWSVYDSLTNTITTPSGVTNPTLGSSTSIYATDTTDYIVSVWDGCSRRDTTGFTIVVKDTTIITMIALDNACPTPDYFSVGMEVSVVSGDTNNTYTWLFGDGEGTTSMSDSIAHNYSSGTYDVQIDVMSESGCPSSFIFIDEVYVYPVPDANFAKDPFDVTILNPTYEFSDLSSVDVIGWDWTFGDLFGTSIEQNPSYTYQDTGIYPVMLIVTNGLCEDTTTKNVKVKPEFLFIIPNTFTPQGDGINEVFMPGTMIGVSEKDYNFFIFDRWGEIIYEGHDLDDGWDGFYKGALSQTGVYVWMIKLKGIDGLHREYRGHVNLLR